MSADSDTLDASIVLERLNEAIEANGNMDIEERTRLIVVGVTTVIALLIPLQKKVMKLETRSIIIWIEKHPRAASTVLLAVILVAMFIHQISPWVIAHLALLSGVTH